MKSFLQRMSLILIPFAFQASILFFYIFPSRIAIYGSNDDALIASFSTDNDLGRDGDNWVFIKSLLSIPTTILQQYFSTLGVYGLVLAFTVIFSISALFILIFFIKSNFLKIIFLVILIVMATIYSSISLINPTYTGAAILSGASGFAILFFLFKTDATPSLDMAILSGFLLTLSYLIRAESFYLAFGFFLVLFIFEAAVVKKGKFSLAALKVPIIFFGTFFIVNLFLDQNNYSDQEWQNYSELNDYRHSIQLRSAEYVLENHLEYLEWSESDNAMFRKFSLADPKKLNIESLTRAMEVSEGTRGISALKNANFKNELIFIKYSYNNLHWLVGLTLLMGAALLVSLALNNFLYSIYFILIIVISLSINFVFAVSYHLPERLIFNFLFLASTALFSIALAEGINIQFLSLPYKFLALFMTFLFFAAAAQVIPTDLEKRITGNIDKLENFKLQRDSILSFDEDAVFFGTGSRIHFQWQDPYRRYENIDTRDNIIFIGWHNLSPIWNKTLLEKGIKPELLHQTVITSDNFYWIDDTRAIPLLEDFYRQYSQSPIFVEDRGSLGDDFYRIFKISTQR